MRVKLKPPFGDLIVLALIVLGFALNIYAPIAFTPPLFQYTVWLYLLCFYAWIPVYIWLLRGRRRPALMTLTILVGGIIFSCTCMTIRPNSAFTVTYLDSITCEEQPQPGGRIRYACTRQAFEGEQFNNTFVYDTLPGLPLMWRVEGDF
jgi:hypothetical protein